SSRRRHTRFDCDWSSDVCSSDLDVGIPNDKPLKEGDIVNIDVTLILDGWHGDSSRMYAVGEIPRRAERLIDVTYDAMMRGIGVRSEERRVGKECRSRWWAEE